MTYLPDLTGILAAYESARRAADLRNSVAASLSGVMSSALVGLRASDLTLMQSAYESARSTTAMVEKIAAERRAIERGVLGGPAWRATLEEIRRNAEMQARIEQSVNQTLRSLNGLHLGTLMRGWAQGQASAPARATEHRQAITDEVSRLAAEQVEQFDLPPDEASGAVRVIAEEVTAALGTVAADAAPAVGHGPGQAPAAEAPGVALPATEDGDTLLALLLLADVHIAERLPRLSAETRRQLVLTLVSVLLGALLSWHIAQKQSASGTADMNRVVAAVGGVAQEQARTNGQVLQLVDNVAVLRAAAPPTRYRTTRAIPVRAEADSNSRRVDTAAAGEELSVRDRVDRWLYVEFPGAGEPRRGWVYHRHLVPLPPR